MNIIVDSKFHAIPYAERTAFLNDYLKAWNETNEAYSDLLSLTQTWADIANREKSPEAYAMYERYYNLLVSAANNFSAGMNPTNRRALLGLKALYAKDITPISRAYEAMKEANTFRDNKGEDAVFEVTNYSSLDPFLHGEVANNKYESKKDITARTAAITSATMLNMLQHPEIRNSMSPLFLEVIQHSGGSLADLLAAIANDPIASNEFAKIKKNMIETLGGLDRFDADGRRAIEGAINEGLYAGLDNPKVGLEKNGEYVDAAQRANIAISRAHLGLAYQQYLDLKAEKARERAIQEGRMPFAVDPDGTKHMSNGVNYWVLKPKLVTVTEANRAVVAKSRGVDPKNIKLGSKYFEYKQGNTTYYGSTPYGYNTPNGSKATLQYQSSRMINEEAAVNIPPIDYTLGITMSGNNNFIRGSETMVSDDEINQASALLGGWDSIPTSLQAYFEENAPEIYNHRFEYTYAYAYYDKNGKVTTKDKGVTKKLIMYRNDFAKELTKSGKK